MKIEHGTNEKGEPTVTYSLPLPDSVDPKHYETVAAIFDRKVREALAAKLDEMLSGKC
jgi:hypothetical protein